MDISKLMYREGLMDGERILVTGGGTGLGREMSEAFLKLGAIVHICGRRQNKLNDTAHELMKAHGGTVPNELILPCFPCSLQNLRLDLPMKT